MPSHLFVQFFCDESFIPSAMTFDWFRRHTLRPEADGKQAQR